MGLEIECLPVLRADDCHQLNENKYKRRSYVYCYSQPEERVDFMASFHKLGNVKPEDNKEYASWVFPDCDVWLAQQRAVARAGRGFHPRDFLTTVDELNETEKVENDEGDVRTLAR